VHVGATAQLLRVVADGDDADLVAVLLAEERDRAGLARLLERGDLRPHVIVVQQHVVDLVLDVREHALRHRATR
jgi:hypothetical protein